MKRKIDRYILCAAVLFASATVASAYVTCQEEGPDSNDEGECTQATAAQPCAAGKTCTTQGGYGNTHCNCV